MCIVFVPRPIPEASVHATVDTHIETASAVCKIMFSLVLYDSVLGYFHLQPLLP